MRSKPPHSQWSFIREHSHKPIKQTRATRMAHAVRLRFGSSNHDYFPLGLWLQQKPGDFLFDSEWLFTIVHCVRRETLASRVRLDCRDKRETKVTRYGNSSSCCLMHFLFLAFIHGDAGVKRTLPMQSRLSRVGSITFNTHGLLLVIHNAEILIFITKSIITGPPCFSLL